MTKPLFVQKSSLLVIGIECRTSNTPERAPHDIPLLWKRFFAEAIASKVPGKISNDIIALYCDYESDYTQEYSLVIGCPVSSLDAIPPGLVGKNVPASPYAVFPAIGQYPQSLIETWGVIWQQKDLERTYTGDYEVYGDKFTSGASQEVDILIPLK